MNGRWLSNTTTPLNKQVLQKHFNDKLEYIINRHTRTPSCFDDCCLMLLPMLSFTCNTSHARYSFRHKERHRVGRSLVCLYLSDHLSNHVLRETFQKDCFDNRHAQKVLSRGYLLRERQITDSDRRQILLIQIIQETLLQMLLLSSECPVLSTSLCRIV